MEPSIQSKNVYEISAAKALFGAALLEYFFYSLIYIIEGFKLEEFQGQQSINTTNKKETPQANQNNVSGSSQNNQKPIDLQEVAVEEEKQGEEETNEQQQQQHPPETTAQNVHQQQLTEENEDTSFEMPFLMLIPKHYQKSTLWFMISLALCAVRTPNNLTITVAYLQVLFRIIQIIGVILHKRLVSVIGYILATLCILILFFAAMIHGMTKEDFFTGQ